MSNRIFTLIIVGLVAIVLFILFAVTSSWLLEWIWLEELGYEGMFETIRSTQVITALLSFIIASLLLVTNFRILAGQLQHAVLSQSPMSNLNIDFSGSMFIKRLRQLFTVGALFFAFVFSSAITGSWEVPLRFYHSISFGVSDPLLNNDVSYYMFELPFWEMIQTSLTVLVFLTLIIVVLVYTYSGMLRFGWNEGIMARPAVLKQISWNGALWLLLLSWGYYLDRYQLLFARDGIVFGAGYTDVNIVYPALWLISGLCLILSIMFFMMPWMRIHKAITGVAGLFLLTIILGQGVIPGLVQQFDVDANELERERTYLEHNIEMTRTAYNLHNVRTVDYTADDTLTIADVRENQDIIDNIRLWDPRLLLRTYKQLQEIRPYYEFNDVDIDRYTINGNREQVMLSARELAAQLPEQSDTWVNRHMQFTHGIGLAMTPVTKTNPQGEPTLYVRDIPPSSDFEDLQVTNPAIYYGEKSHNYYIVNTDSEELHYPRSGDNVYKHYAGQGGIPFSSWFRKLLIAWEMGDINILLSDQIHEESRFQNWRGIRERIRKITPFLKLDDDPYLVLNEGRMYWIQDAYTTSSHFPYSQPVIGGRNYIRNSVKIVIDAYEGSVDYYIADDEDPVVQMYGNMFPDLLQPMENMPDGLKEHLRYPQDLFEAQLELYNRYHMTNPRVFYNNEDRWVRPNEKYAGRRIRMEPYYVMAKLPGEDVLEYMLISPVTPEDRNNMISWMSARSDPENYGELISFQLPRERLIYGPAQIESRIDQDPEISRQIALWDQRGSRVIRGNLMVIPVANSFLYVEPVFLLADQDDIPQLQRVIVAVGEEISMQPTLEGAIRDLFDEETLFPEAELIMPLAEDAPDARVAPQQPAETTVEQFRKMEEVQSVWNDLRHAMEQDDWARFGELLEELDRLLEELGD